MTSLLAAPLPDVPTPSIAYHALWPVWIIFGAACLGVLIEAFVPRAERFAVQVSVTITALLGAFVSVLLLHKTSLTTPLGTGSQKGLFAGAIAVDGVGLFIQGSILILAVMSVLLISERAVEGSPIVAQAAVVVGSPRDRQLMQSERVQTEVFPLALFAVGGMLIFPIANNLLLMFVALEVLSLPLYLMAGLSRRRRLLSQEAAVKYFLLGGLLFKAGIAPFHSWTPDVYQGSPTAVTAFMASCTKVAAFGAILRVLYVGFSSTRWDWRPMMWGVAIASMAVGAIVGLTQTDVKRILAYSSIAHAGFLLVGLIALSKDGISSTLFYLLTYGFSTVAAFGLVTLVRDANGEATHLSQWSGLARKSPLVATVMTILLMSMAGIPLTAGFVGKFAVFRAAYHEAAPLVVIALVASAIAAFYYLRIVVLMFFAEPPDNAPTIAIPSPASAVALTLGTLVTIVLGVFPQPVLDLAEHAAKLRG